MPSPQNRSPVPVGAHLRPFLVSIAVGAVLALGVRSMSLDADGSAPAAQAEPGPAHHAEPGHDEHGHEPGEAPTETPGPDAHANHGATGSAVPSEPPQKPAADAGETGALLALGNAVCPVMGGDVNGEVFTDWNGLRVGHCCAPCKERFLKNPESLLDEASPGWRDAVAAAKALDAAAPGDRAALIEQTAKKWTVLREPAGSPAAPEPKALLVDLGNTACPVMQGDVDGKTFTEWNGLRVGHCCPGCSKRFLKAPDELLDEVAPEWRAAAAAVKAANEAPAGEREARLAEVRKRWRVVREPAHTESE